MQPFQNNEEINNINKKKKKNQNKSPNKSYNNNNSLNYNQIINPNYNPNINNKMFKNQNYNHMQINMGNNMSLSSQGPKNTIPNFLPGDLTFTANQGQIISPYMNKNNNIRNAFIGPKNQQMINNIQNNKNKDLINNGYNMNNLGSNNNKKHQKQYNYNIYQGYSNNNNIMNKNKNNFEMRNNSNKETNNQHGRQCILELKLNLGKNKMTTIRITSLDDCKNKINILKEKELINDTMGKIINDKILMAIELKRKIFDAEVDKYTYKNLNKIKWDKNFCNELGGCIKLKKNKSLTKKWDNKIKLALNEIEQFEPLNISL
jgi:hypothetical protein